MHASSSPLISVVTPAYNEEEYLAECIESVLAQTYDNWEYTIVNNCSTDGTLRVAEKYAAQSSRIRVITNDRLIPAVPNFNLALRQISPVSKYCKMVLADDWMFPECLERMVAVMEDHPSVGIVGAYGLQYRWVLWDELPYPSTRVSGRDMCRQRLFGGHYLFGTPTSVLFRSDVVRSRDPFFNEATQHADSEACFEVLKHSDFGFVHQVLTFSRDDRPNSMLNTAKEFNTAAAAFVHELVQYGPYYLSAEEYSSALNRTLSNYYEFLGTSLLQGRGQKFWEFHRNALKEVGLEFEYTQVLRALVRRYRREFRRIKDTDYWGVLPAE